MNADEQKAWEVLVAFANVPTAYSGAEAMRKDAILAADAIIKRAEDVEGMARSFLNSNGDWSAVQKFLRGEG